VFALLLRGSVCPSCHSTQSTVDHSGTINTFFSRLRTPLVPQYFLDVTTAAPSRSSARTAVYDQQFLFELGMRVAARNCIAVDVAVPMGTVCMTQYGYIPNRPRGPPSLVTRPSVCSMRVNLLLF